MSDIAELPEEPPIPDPEESLRAEFDRLVSELRQTRAGLRGRAGTVMSTAATYAIAVDDTQKDREGYPERMRAQRHHDVLCLVLKEQLRAYYAEGKAAWRVDNASMVHVAKSIADIAYPPPRPESNSKYAAQSVEAAMSAAIREAQKAEP